MRKSPIFSATVKDGRLKLDNQEKFDEYLMTLPEKIDVIVKPHVQYMNRSNNQNRYFHGYILEELSNHLGYTTEEIKEILKYRFLKTFVFIETKDGQKEIATVKPTSSLNTAEFEDFLRRIREWSAIDLKCYLALPNEVDYE